MENTTRLSIGKLVKMTPREQDVLARQKANSGLQQIIEAVLSPGTHAPRGGPSTRLAVHPRWSPGQPGPGPRGHGDICHGLPSPPEARGPRDYSSISHGHFCKRPPDGLTGRVSGIPRHSAGDLGSSPGASFLSSDWTGALRSCDVKMAVGSGHRMFPG